MSKIKETLQNIENLIEQNKTKIKSTTNDINILKEKYKKLLENNKNLSKNEKLNIAQQFSLYKQKLNTYYSTVNKLTKNAEFLKQTLNTPQSTNKNKITEELEELNKIEEELNNINDTELNEELDKLIKDDEETEKTKQQQENLSLMEQKYEKKTGKKFNPLVTLDDEYNTVQKPLQNLNITNEEQQENKPTLNILKHTPNTKSNTKSNTKNKTRKRRTNTDTNDIEMTYLGRHAKTSTIKNSEEVDSQIPHIFGFSETLKATNKNPNIDSPDVNICQNIFLNGLKVNKKYYFPSEFPKLTKIKPIIAKNSNNILKKKGGKCKLTKKRSIKSK